ncbi:MAG: D-lyxose/D-mannose family sugar isomerase [Eudoraea sp.]|nr:D-lyxose/D-mannose family sugar isomerase [Eudoraea sp.]
MRRSEINQAIRDASSFFLAHGWTLPPYPKWDITDFGLGKFNRFGLVLVNLAEEAEYCEKLMYARKNQVTPAHMHKKKKEDIICRTGKMAIQVWNGSPEMANSDAFFLKVNGVFKSFVSGDILSLQNGERVTLTPGLVHEFFPESEECIIGEVSTANDDLNDNFFINPGITRFSNIEEDEPAIVKLISD